MPKLKIDRVVSYSSEDPIHTASNILLPEPSKKWKCSSEGEKCASVILQLEKASLISSIDIGNEHSAYVEVLVKRSGGTHDFKVLLVMSSFMSPLESRNSTNINKVRMFGFNELQSPERDEKWDCIKIVCTQPFNRHVQYGLSFITLHTLENKDHAVTNSSVNLGKFALRPNSPINLATGSLFARRNEIEKDTQVSAAAAIREACASTNTSYKSPKVKLSTKETTPSSHKPDTTVNTSNNDSPKRRNRDELLYSKDEEDAHEKIDKVIKKRKKEIEEKQNKDEELKKKQKQKKQEEKHSINDKEHNKNGKNQLSATPSTSHSHTRKPNENTPKKSKAPNNKKPFNKLLEGVMIVISGIQNPERSTIRSNAMELGAKYKPDWDNTCTHLICAFTNTPKFNQVKGKGKIVNRIWIQDCYNQRKRLPWRRYALDRNDLQKNESEDEICEDMPGSPDVQVVCTSPTFGNDTDTEDEIERITTLQKEKGRVSRSSYSVDTDEEILKRNVISKLPELPSVLLQKKLYIDDEFNEEQRRFLNRYIVALDGSVLDVPTEVDFIITTSKNSDFLKEVCASALAVKPDWIWDSFNEKRLAPVDNYLL